MATAVSAWSAWKKVDGSSNKRRIRAVVNYSVTTTNTQVIASAYLYMQEEGGTFGSSKATGCLGATDYGTSTGSGKFQYKVSSTVVLVSTRTYTWNRTTSGQTKYISAKMTMPSSSLFAGTYTVPNIAVSVPALASYSVSYNANGGEGTVASQTKWYGINLGLSNNLDAEGNHLLKKTGWSLKEWNTMADGSGTSHALGGTYTGNSAVTLYAIWQPDFPPTADVERFGITSGFEPIKYFGKYTAKFKVTNVYDGGGEEEPRIATAKLVIGESETTPIPIVNGQTYTITSSIIDESGMLDAYLFLEDSVGATTQIALEPVTQSEPVWERTFHITDAKVPDLDSSGNADVKVSLGVEGDTEVYVEYTRKLQFTGVDYDWYITVQFSEEFVDDVHSANPDVAVKIEYTHTDTDETENRKAFYNTTRNQNFSNGIYSVMFVGGVIPEKSPSYASRVWWCDINDPLYFPDNNYAEVGSNDTRVMGLCKVGNYLGAVKQSKTTDTGIYLLYPTSFDEDTAFAQKQGIQGVGAIAKYSFNVLGDETLFLSPEGVMAIRPDGDESHKVVNRSFFVDGRLLAETSIEEAYSFVFDGKYWLSIGDHCYVLDGNQQSSWGNDRTNLVLECYYLENVPASCFMKMGDELWFSNEDCVCRFKNEHYSDQYTDAYEYGEGNENVPVKAEWSTILDDDGSMHYLKTMQKKGNVVSILPVGGEPYISVGINEDEFDEDKTIYYILIDGEYVQCTEDSEFDEEETYYIINVNTSAEVYIKKDAEEPIFVGEVNGQVEETGDIPNELVVRKKIKKYKRLQFIIRNNKAEGLGIDNITKSYVVGNYVKK